MFNLDFYTFNTIEGIFWVALSFVVAFFIANGVPKEFRFLGFYTALTLLIFGVSDLVENLVVGYPYAREWLFIGKALCVLALSGAVIWYIRIRRQEHLY